MYVLQECNHNHYFKLVIPGIQDNAIKLRNTAFSLLAGFGSMTVGLIDMAQATHLKYFTYL